MKQETLEEAMNANGYHDKVNDTLWREGVKFGAKWQTKNLYTEEELKLILDKTLIEYSDVTLADIPDWFNYIKKKL